MAKIVPPKKGDRIHYWTAGNDSGIATIVGVRPYTGRYTEWFKWFVKMTAERTKSGHIETAMSESTWRLQKAE